MNIEVEVRSFISEDKYKELIGFFTKQGKFLSEDSQVTYYFDCEEDLRIQKNDFFSKVWLKKGKIHDDHREEIEIKYGKDDFELLEKLFLALGHNVDIKWFRKRHTFEWQNVNVMVDYTKGYGYIIELELKAAEKDKDKILELLKQKLKSLNIPLTPKEEFNKKYEYYKKNWKNLVDDNAKKTKEMGKG
ncbi:CYTH domain-containing protein [Candidatus Woesearchaeota archaeon]|nr:CYTH domain-containing protein [Candidatus Woesearchaeota archaeon]